MSLPMSLTPTTESHRQNTSFETDLQTSFSLTIMSHVQHQQQIQELWARQVQSGTPLSSCLHRQALFTSQSLRTLPDSFHQKTSWNEPRFPQQLHGSQWKEIKRELEYEESSPWMSCSRTGCHGQTDTSGQELSRSQNKPSLLDLLSASMADVCYVVKLPWALKKIHLAVRPGV